jgi:acetylornithine deacetylase/succinyl-diaminopimelate desuccinylase-like protein
VKADGHTPAVEGFFDKVKPLSPELKKILADAIPKRSEASAKKALSTSRWIGDEPWAVSLERLVSQPTINIEGLVGGYTGPGGKTILPNRAVAKIDMRLVPDMTAKGALELVKAHLAKHGFGDIEVNVSGGYDPTSTVASAPLIQAQVSVLKRAGIAPLMWPRNPGSYPGYVFTGAPLSMASGHFGLGHGSGAHAPDEYYVIESSNPAIQGFDGAVLSFVQYLYELAK